MKTHTHTHTQRRQTKQCSCALISQRRDISTLNGRYLKIGDKFIDLWSSVSSTENGINTFPSKASITIGRQSVI